MYISCVLVAKNAEHVYPRTLSQLLPNMSYQEKMEVTMWPRGLHSKKKVNFGLGTRIAGVSINGM
jgi:hypothetical protein